MFKRILVGGSVFVGLGLTGLSALAQSASPAPAFTMAQAAPESPAPEAAPAPAPATPDSPETSPAPANTNVSQDELEKFANAIQEFQSIQQEAQQQASAILNEEEMSWDRFNQILQTEQNPQATPPSPEVSSDEQQSFDRAKGKLAELQQSTRERMNTALQEEGLPRERFAQILAMVRQDAGLRQRIEQELNK